MIRTALITLLVTPLAVSSSSPTRESDYSADVRSMESTLEALYDVISGPAGAERDWDRFHHLFIPEGARLIPLGPARDDGELALRVYDPAGYAERSAPFFEQSGFYESEIHREVQEFGRLVHVFSTYEGRREEGGEVFLRGINSIQLLHERDRWWIVSIYWEPEAQGNPLPARYLPPSDSGR